MHDACPFSQGIGKIDLGLRQDAFQDPGCDHFVHYREDELRFHNPFLARSCFLSRGESSAYDFADLRA